MIRLATIEDLKSIEQLLDDVTIDLLKKGVEQWDYPWSLNWSDGLYVKNITENLNVDTYLDCWNGNSNLKKD